MRSPVRAVRGCKEKVSTVFVVAATNKHVAPTSKPTKKKGKDTQDLLPAPKGRVPQWTLSQILLSTKVERGPKSLPTPIFLEFG